MKRIIFFLTLFICTFFTFSTIFPQSYQTYGPITPTYSRSIYLKNGQPSSDAWSIGLIDSNGSIYTGPDGLSVGRSNFEWIIPGSTIPEYSEIDTIEIFFTYQTDSPTYGFMSFYYYSFGIDLYNVSHFGPLWDSTSGTNYIGSGQGYKYGLTGYSTTDTVRSVFVNGSNFVNLFYNTFINNGFFTLGIKSQNENNTTDCFVDCSIKLRIVYKLPTVTVDQKLPNNSSYGSVSHYENGNFVGYAVPHQFALQTTTPSFRADTNAVLQSGIYQKYNNWNDDNARVTNYKDFIISSGTTSIFSRLNTTANTTISNTVDGFTGLSAGSIQFKDPWLRDTIDAKGLRNRGTTAVFTTLSSPFSPGISTNYKGVFLNQNYSTNPAYYSVGSPLTQTAIVNGANHTLYFQNWSASNATVQSPSNLQTPVVFTGDGAVVYANLKGTQFSSNSGAIANNSQRKYVKTPDGTLHLCYESLGHVWYETSIDNGANWKLMNSGKPIDNGAGKLPSMDWATYKTSGITYYYLLIIYQEQTSTGFNIKLKLFDTQSDGEYFILKSSATIDSVTNDTYSTNVNPVVCYDTADQFTAVWERKAGTAGLYYRYGSSTDAYGIYNLTNPTIITGTNSYSQHPAIATCKGSNQPFVRQLVWDESNAIKYIKLISSGLVGSIQNLSSGSGFSINHNPSIIAIPDSSARVCWVGDLTGLGNVVQTVFKSTNNTRFWSFGNYVQSSTITRDDNNSRYIVAWNSTSGNTNSFTDSRTLSTIYSLGVSGNFVQISNGTTPTDMYGTVFKTSATPYNFNTTNSIGSIAPKSSALAISSGRGGIMVKDDAQFYFTLGGITLDNSNINFIFVPDTAEINDMVSINNVLVTEPFNLTDNSNLTYSVIYGVSDSAKAVLALDKAGTVSFRIELIDNSDGSVIGTFDNIQYNYQNIHNFNSMSYQVNTNGIGNKIVKLRLVLESNINPEISMIDTHSDEKTFGKTSSNQISYKGSSVIKEYSLEQNYPNPFNPTTVINYQVPKDGLVTIKIYDVLGNEIRTLVNDNRVTGKYSVSFDGSKLASGVYFYQLRVSGGASNFITTKKMLLIK